MISSTDYKEKKGEITKRIAILEDQLQTSITPLIMLLTTLKRHSPLHTELSIGLRMEAGTRKELLLSTLDLNPALDRGFLSS